MIMRVGGRFPYLHEPENVFAAQGKERRGFVGMCVYMHACLYLEVCVWAEGVEISDGPVDAESKHNNKQFHQPMLVQ